MPANHPKMSSVVAMLLDSKQVENVCIVPESVIKMSADSASASFASSTANTTTLGSHVVKVVDEEEDSSFLSNMP